MSIKKPQTDHESDVATVTREKTARPPLYKVLLLNDDYTPMEFVMEVLRTVFGINEAQAYVLMMTVHTKGAAVVGVFTFEIAETKVVHVLTMARKEGHPLQCVLEKEE